MCSKIFAVILNWDNYKDTAECIISLKKSSLKVSKIILVDNGSKDGSLEKLQKEYQMDQKVHIIQNEFNLGFAAGVNVGILFALEQRADYVFLLNNDAIIDANCIKYLISEADKDYYVGIVGPRIFYYKDPQRVWQGGGNFSFLKTGVINPEKDKLVVGCDEKVKKVTFLTGCALLIKREVFEKIGLFDENFFFYEEDLDFCLQASRAGFKLLYVPYAKAWHKIEAIAKGRTSPFVLYNLARSRVILLRKNFPWYYFLYGLSIHIFLYTPFRFLQIIRGSRNMKSLWAWLCGTGAGIFNILGYRQR